MKKLMLSALAVSVMFVSCSKDNDDVNPAGKEKDQKESFASIATIQNSVNKGEKVSEAKDAYNKVKPHLAVDAFHVQSKDAVRKEFGDWIDAWGGVVENTVTATQGTAGKLGKRLLNEKGLEYSQLIKKGLIGAYQLSNALNEAQKAMKPGADNQAILENVTSYLLGSYASLENQKVEMESHGEKFKGYPVYDGNEFAKYLNVVSRDSDFSTVADDLYGALRDAKKNVNADSFKNHILKAVGIAEKVVAIRGAFYLVYGSKDANKLGSNLDHGAAHAISEGLGFVYSLQFTYNPTSHTPYFSKVETDTFFDSLDLWDASAKTKLETKAEEIAQIFGFDINHVKN